MFSRVGGGGGGGIEHTRVYHQACKAVIEFVAFTTKENNNIILVGFALYCICNRVPRIKKLPGLRKPKNIFWLVIYNGSHDDDDNTHQTAIKLLL